MSVEFTLEYLDTLKSYQQILLGIVASCLLAVLVRYLVWTPMKWVVGRSETAWDDDLLELAAPLVNYSVFLAGVYFTVLYAVDETSTIRAVSATLLIIILMFLIARFLSKSVSRFLPPAIETFNERAGAESAGLSTAITVVIKIVIWGSAALIIMDTLNIEITAALASLTIFSLVIGMAMQESASNLIISAQLLMDRPFEIGDKIQLGAPSANPLIGVVTEIGFVSTKIKTSTEHLVIIPNKVIASDLITNFARGGPGDTPRRVNLRLDFGVGYGEKPSHVKQVLRDVVEECDLVLQDPTPKILFTHMMDSSLTFRLNCWVGDYSDEWVARDIIMTNVLNRFDEENIEIPYPHMQIKYETIDEEKAKAETRAKAKAEAVKEKRQVEAKAKEQAEQARMAEERKRARASMDELRVMLDDEELEDEKRVELSSELLALEDQLALSDDD
jgi:small-conductance mechanosensitive channel